MVNNFFFDLDGTLTDSKVGIVKSVQYSLESFGVLYGYGDHKELSEAGADHIVRDVDELSDLLLSFK